MVYVVERGHTVGVGKLGAWRQFVVQRGVGFDGFQVVGLGILRGMSDVKVPTLITFIAYWVIGLPIGYVLGFNFHLGPNGIWIGLLLGLAFAAILLFKRFQWKSRQHL